MKYILYMYIYLYVYIHVCYIHYLYCKKPDLVRWIPNRRIPNPHIRLENYYMCIMCIKLRTNDIAIEQVLIFQKVKRFKIQMRRDLPSTHLCIIINL